MPRRLRPRLDRRHQGSDCTFVEDTAGINYEQFRSDLKTQDAVIRNIGIIGEAAKGISAEFKRLHKTIEWKGNAGM